MAWSCNVPIAPPSLLLLGIHVLAILDLVSALLSLRKPAFHPTQLFAAKLQILIPRPPAPPDTFLATCQRKRLIVSKCTVCLRWIMQKRLIV